MARRPRNATRNVGDAPPAYRFERLIMLALAVVLVAAMIFVVVTNVEPTGTVRLVLFVLVAMTAGGFFAFLPGGALKVGNSLPGLTIKAGGGAAAFVIVLYLLFNYADEPKQVTMLPPGAVDLRSEYPASSPRYLDGRVALIVPVGFDFPDGKPVAVQRLEATLTLGTKPIAGFAARHVTTLRQGATGDGWLPFRGQYLAGAQFVPGPAQEIAFYGRDGERWGALLDEIAAAGGEGVVQIRATLVGGRELARSCSINMRRVDGRPLGDATAPKPDNISRECVI